MNELRAKYKVELAPIDKLQRVPAPFGGVRPNSFALLFSQLPACRQVRHMRCVRVFEN